MAPYEKIKDFPKTQHCALTGLESVTSDTADMQGNQSATDHDEASQDIGEQCLFGRDRKPGEGDMDLVSWVLKGGGGQM
ncbi:hypothetical protein ACTXT7_014195 [Hymenolepis weldensis]